ncbi:DUF721 domain-containing protein [Aquimarina sp. ERC-38]|uniref:DUF721 domain-containing protein n=1 Tax=Aquimarina sp. ERC-38 TaxID=2949996 RepID=UPI002245F94F|nr:DUF721 domain-containing protein [Aquimarina sp. ERC-38]UZO79938.1 DUF721 domain-containing protein [Aquimarina sp. ERC-38]
MSRSKIEYQSIQDVLKDFVQENKLEKGLDDVKARDAWFAVMGTAIANYTQAIKYKNNVLYVELTSSVLREELSYGKQKIVANLNEQLQSELIQKLILR